MARTEEGWEPQPGRRSGPQPLRDALRGEIVGGGAPAKEEHQTQWASDFASEFRTSQFQKSVAVSEDWKRMLPPGSKWEPGKLGKPDCAMCLGLGFVSVDLPLGHPKQGKVLYCECRRRSDYPRLKTKKQLDDEAADAANRS